MSAVRAANVPPIPESRVKAFDGLSSANEWLLSNPERTLGGLHFNVLDATNIALTLQGNHSAKVFRGEFQDPNYFFEMPLQVATQREMSRCVSYNWLLRVC